ncbi:SCL-interrupting locus protein homolog [Genypterus blacodes]|uniref:SCL-interrupting locus protein homolog n=1 Tax=Genypterus blacodes TaxID=154954 RepID=UPI003F776CC5
MSCPGKQGGKGRASPPGDGRAPETVRRGASVNSLTLLSFPKSRSALWDSSPAGETLSLHLCSHRKPRLILLEKALRLAQRHARHTNQPRLHCFFLGSLTVDADEQGVTVTLDRFDPGREPGGASGRVPSALLPGDVLLPCVFSTQRDADIQSEAQLHQTFKALQQYVSGRQARDLSQLLQVRGHILCSQQGDAASFSLSWSAVSPAACVHVQPVRALPIIPTALLRSLSGLSGLSQAPRVSGPQRGFLTMDQSRKLLLLLESDPKASSLPVVGVWLSGVTHVYHPQVWAWCLRFLFSSALQDRVFSESGRFLLLLFSQTHRAAQFFQCHCSPSGPPHLDYQLLSATQAVVLYQQVVPSEGGAVSCDLGSEEHSRQTQVFRAALSSFSSAPPAPGLSVSDQDSGLEDEDPSPRPSPSPHAPAQQARRVQPSVPELSLLIDSSFVASNQIGWQDSGSSHRPPPPGPLAEKKPVPPARPPTWSSSAPWPPPHLYSTPNSNMESCTCCPAPSYDCTSIHPEPPFINHSVPYSSRLCPPSVPPPPHLHTPPPYTHAAPWSKPSPPLPPSLPAPSHPHHSAPPPVPPLIHHPVPEADSPSPLSKSCSPPPQGALSSPPAPGAPSAASPLPLLRHVCPNPCCEREPGGAVPSDAYRLLLQQDRQLRLLQAQVQMLLEAQVKPQVDSTPRTVSSIAVGTGASLFWGDPVERPDRPPSSPNPPSSSKPPPSSPGPTPSPSRSSSHEAPPPLLRPVGGVVEDDLTVPEGPCSPAAQTSLISRQSPVLGESVSMYALAEDQRFYQDLKSQLTHRLHEEEEQPRAEESGRRRSLSVVSSCSQSSSSSSSTSSRQQQRSTGDSVGGATVLQLQQLGVQVDQNLSLRTAQQTVESTSPLACISPAALDSRLTFCDPSGSSLFLGGSVDLSLKANAISLRHLSDSELCRLSLGGHAPRSVPASSTLSMLSPSNMSLATRKYMRRNGLIEEESGEDEEQPEERHPLTEALNEKLRQQSQPKPKMKLSTGDAKPRSADKENRTNRRPSLGRTSSRLPEGSVGNFLDLSRLRQLPKLF